MKHNSNITLFLITSRIDKHSIVNDNNNNSNDGSYNDDNINRDKNYNNDINNIE